MQVGPVFPRPGFLHDGCPRHIPQLRGHIEFHHAVEAQGGVCHAVEFVHVTAMNRLYLVEPLVDEPLVLMAHRMEDPAAMIMPAHDDMLHLEHLYRVLEDAQHTQVVIGHLICDVPVHEQLARIRSGNVFGWHT